MKLYEFTPSGNCYKVRLLLTQLQIPFKRIEIDITKGQADTSDFLKKNPNGRVPVLEIEEGKFLSESNAILFYLAEGTSFLPTNKLDRARLLSWLFFEQYSHEPNIATPRYWIAILREGEAHRSEIEQKRQAGHQALEVMESYLSRHDFLVGGQYSIADIALYAYTHVADEGGFDLSKFPSIKNWFRRIEAQPSYLKITE